VNVSKGGRRSTAEPASGSTPLPVEEKAQLERGCENGIPIEFFVCISRVDEYLAFTKDAAPRMVTYIIAVLVGAWIVGFAVAKALPRLVQIVARWLTE